MSALASRASVRSRFVGEACHADERGRPRSAMQADEEHDVARQAPRVSRQAMRTGERTSRRRVPFRRPVDAAVPQLDPARRDARAPGRGSPARAWRRAPGRRPSSSSMICAPVAESRLPVGSSARSRAAGWPTRARAPPAAARRPRAAPDSGRPRSASPTSPSSAAARAGASAHAGQLERHRARSRRRSGSGSGERTGTRSRSCRGGARQGVLVQARDLLPGDA